MSDSFESAEAGQFWKYIESTLERLVEIVREQPEDILFWQPPAPETNPIIVLVRHMLANAEVNICWSLGADMGIHYDREANFESDITVAELLTRWDDLHGRMTRVMRALPQSLVDGPVQHHWRGQLPGREILIIVARHCAEHLGQAELTLQLARAASAS